MVLLLRKMRYSNRGGGTKYYMDCSKYVTKNDALQIKSLIQNKHHITVLKAVANDITILKKNKHIVIKIGPSNKTTQKEYEIGELLYSNKLSGFIKYNCIFTCYDNTDETIEININKRNKPKLPSNICDAEKTEENKKDVLIMPYVKDGSVENYEWTEQNVSILKNLLLQAILSLTVAFQKIGFIHGDLHLGNLLFKPTTKTHLSYSIDGIPEKIHIETTGYKLVIMDFEKSIMGIQEHEHGIATFWDGLLNLCKKFDTGLKVTNSCRIDWNNADILQFLKNARNIKKQPHEIIGVIDKISSSEFTFIPIITYSYNPNL
jgi:hypothetical protein